jgi:hypothetical protein
VLDAVQVRAEAQDRDAQPEHALDRRRRQEHPAVVEHGAEQAPVEVVRVAALGHPAEEHDGELRLGPDDEAQRHGARAEVHGQQVLLVQRRAEPRCPVQHQREPRCPWLGAR